MPSCVPWALLVCGALSVSWPASGYGQTPSGPVQPLNAGRTRTLVDQYCVTCHSERLKTGGLVLEGLNAGDVPGEAAVWEKVVRKLRAGLMPPANARRPDTATYDSLTTWIEQQLDHAGVTAPNPGRTSTFHRLNVTEFQNAVRDLLHIDLDVRSLLPMDDASYGFDNIAGVLKLDPSRLERYLSVADRITRLAVGIPPSTPQPERLEVSENRPQYDRLGELPAGTRGGALLPYYFPQDAVYEFTVEILTRGRVDNGQITGQLRQPDVLEMMIDGERVHTFPFKNAAVRGGGDVPQLTVRLPVKAGPRRIGFAFPRHPAVEPVTQRAYFQRPQFERAAAMPLREPYFKAVTINGPFDVVSAGDTPSRRAIFACTPATATAERPCAKTLLGRLARRAYRRPVTADDVTHLLEAYDLSRAEGQGFERAVQVALQRLLVSPEFLFRIEVDPAGISRGANYRVSDLDLASRLSFFLWSSIPDNELLTLASGRSLGRPAALERQVTRMLLDDRSAALVANFAGQWLQLRNLELAQPASALYPDFDEELRAAFRKETELFLKSVIREDRSVMALIDANYTFLNERLAAHYGIPYVKGPHFRRVALPAGSPRGGLLGHGSILTITSHGNRTSPVLRGKWILSNVLGSPPPEPPANVPSLPEKDAASAAVSPSVRERMAHHRRNPVCASCHSMIDPLGFALENFDATGRWREVDEGFSTIDASGVMPDGGKFGGFSDLQASLMSRPDRFATLFVEKLLTYALGRGLEPYDMPAVRTIVRSAATKDYRISALVTGVVTSVPFTMRRAAAAKEEQP